MDSSWIIALVLVLEVPLLILVVMGLRYLAAKAKIDLTDRQWELVQSAVQEAVTYVEQEKLKIKKTGGKPLTTAEKMSLAKDMVEKLLDRLSLTPYKPLVVPLIEAKLFQLFNSPEQPQQ